MLLSMFSNVFLMEQESAVGSDKGDIVWLRGSVELNENDSKAGTVAKSALP